MPKPDDRSDNVEKLQGAIDHTMENLRETQDHLRAHRAELNPGTRHDLTEKNQRRERAIRGFREEIKDEAHHKRSH